MQWLRRFKPFLLLALVLCTGLLAGCDGGGGGGGGTTPPNPAEGSTWDQMGWDQGKWG